jgi:hypothetical protein
MATTTPEARAQIIADALKAEDAQQNAERIRLPWKDDEYTATVIKIPLTAVVLNPRSHRIRSQLESATKKDVVARDPFGEDAQNVIAEILRNTERFDDLKANLKDVGQTDPGAVSHNGLLVNANTRCVALKDLGERYIRVAVLPQDASQEEIDRLELRLQMKRDFRRPYTFTNELLFIEDLVKQYHDNAGQIATAMNWASEAQGASLKKATEQVQQRLRMLALIREVQYMSGQRVPLTDFDNTQQAIQEIDEDYEELKKRDEGAARRLRDTRVVGVLSDVGYRELREIDESFVENYLLPSMEEQDLFRGITDRLLQLQPSENGEQLPGLDVLGPAEVQPVGQRTAAPLLTLLTETAGKERVIASDGNGPLLDQPRTAFIAELKAAIINAAQDARDDRQEGDRLDRPRTLVRRASRIVRNASQVYQRVKTMPAFNAALFRTAVEELRTAQQALDTMMQDNGE